MTSPAVASTPTGTLTVHTTSVARDVSDEVLGRGKVTITSGYTYIHHSSATEPVTYDLAKFKLDDAFGKVFVESTRYTYPNRGYTEHKQEESSGTRVRFTGNPEDRLTFSVGKDDWVTTVEVSGVVYGERPGPTLG